MTFLITGEPAVYTSLQIFKAKRINCFPIHAHLWATIGPMGAKYKEYPAMEGM
jgi:hypothetical protein